MSFDSVTTIGTRKSPRRLEKFTTRSVVTRYTSQKLTHNGESWDRSRWRAYICRPIWKSNGCAGLAALGSPAAKFFGRFSSHVRSPRCLVTSRYERHQGFLINERPRVTNENSWIVDRLIRELFWLSSVFLWSDDIGLDAWLDHIVTYISCLRERWHTFKASPRDGNVNILRHFKCLVVKCAIIFLFLFSVNFASSPLRSQRLRNAM